MNNKTKVLAGLLLTSTISIGSTVGIYNEKLEAKETKIVKMQEKMELKNSEIANLEDSVKNKNEKIKDYKGKNNLLIKNNKNIKKKYSKEISKLKAKTKKLESENSKLNYKIKKVSSDNSNFNKVDERSDATAIGKASQMSITAYTSGYESTQKSVGDVGYGLTASGTHVQEGRTIACPKSMPFGTVLNIEGIGMRVCEDRGGAIGEGHIDLYIENLAKAQEFGKKSLNVEIVR